MTDQEDNINLSRIVFDGNNQERKSWACLGQTCSRSLIVFLSQLFVILLIIICCFWKIHLSKLVTNQLFGLEFCAVRQDTFSPHQDYEKVIFSTKNRDFVSLVGTSEIGKSQLVYNWLKLGTFQLKFDRFYFFINILNLFTMLCKRKLKISSLCVE